MAEFDDEIMLLVTGFLDGRVNAQQLRRLNELLSTHTEARTYYLEMLTIQAGLKSMMGKGAKLSDMLVRLDKPDQIPAKNISNVNITLRPASAQPES